VPIEKKIINVNLKDFQTNAPNKKNKIITDAAGACHSGSSILCSNYYISEQ
jgi:hypothetical protein